MGRSIKDCEELLRLQQVIYFSLFHLILTVILLLHHIL